jgi:hypothetical protein
MVWKVVYTTYKNDYPDSKLQERKPKLFFTRNIKGIENRDIKSARLEESCITK